MGPSLRVVLEGPDGAGKSTLARSLQDRYATRYEHAGPPHPGATPASLVAAYATMLFDRHSGVGAVVDRWALGETIYGPRFRGRSLIGPTEWGALARLLSATYTPFVLCLPAKSVCAANFRATLEQQKFPDPVAHGKVYDAYQTWANVPGALVRPTWTWIYAYEEPGALEKLLEFLDDMARGQA